MPFSREIQEQLAVRERLAGDAVAAAADRHREGVLAGEANRLHHVGRPRTAGDERGTMVDARVPIRRASS